MQAIKKESAVPKYRDWHDQSETDFARKLVILAVCLGAAALTVAAVTGSLDSILAPLFRRLGL